MKLYLYDSNGNYLHSIEGCEGITYHNSTKIKPDFEGKDPDIYQARWDNFTQKWIIELKPDFISKKAKELGLDLVTITSMSEQDLRSGKLPEITLSE